MTMGVPSISVVIVNWNGMDCIPRCLESLRTAGKAAAAQIIVVDNASSDGSADFVRTTFPEVEFIQSSTNLGFGKACNAGAGLAQGKYLLFLNPDTIVQESTLKQVSDLLDQESGIDAVGCKIFDDDGTPWPLALQRYPTPMSEFVLQLGLSTRLLRMLIGSEAFRGHDASQDVLILSGACLAVRQDVYKKAGGFDERFFMYSEDVEFCHRLHLMGASLRYCAGIAITHARHSCAKKAPQGFRTLMMCESRFRYMKKYYGTFGGGRYRAAMFFAGCLRLLICVCALGIFVHTRRSQLQRWQERCEKSRWILAWSCGAAKAQIPS